MTHDDLLAIQRANAFNPTPRHDDLYALHVPFDQLTNTATCEHALDRALRHGHRVALVGASGAGKSSVTEHVLGPLVDGLAPMRIPVAMERPEVATDPAAFAQHLITLVRRWVTTSLPAKAGGAAAIAPRPKGIRTQKFSIAPAWMDAKVDLAYELSQASQTEPATATQTIQQARHLIDLIASDDLRPVIVLDDTDRWLSTSYQPDNPIVRGAFFGRVVRILAEDLGTAAIVAVHPSYLQDPTYQGSRGFLDTTINIPALPHRDAARQLLRHRANLILESPATGEDLLDDTAADLLFDHYAAAPNVRKTLLLVADAALTLAVDDRADTITATHCIGAITQTDDRT